MSDIGSTECIFRQSKYSVNVSSSPSTNVSSILESCSSKSETESSSAQPERTETNNDHLVSLGLKRVKPPVDLDKIYFTTTEKQHEKNNQDVDLYFYNNWIGSIRLLQDTESAFSGLRGITSPVGVRLCFIRDVSIKKIHARLRHLYYSPPEAPSRLGYTSAK